MYISTKKPEHNVLLIEYIDSKAQTDNDKEIHVLTYMFHRMYSSGQLIIEYNFRKINILQFNPTCLNVPFLA